MDVRVETIGPGTTDLEVELGDPMIDLSARRLDVVRRLIDRGVPERTLRALLPDWDPLIREANASR